MTYSVTRQIAIDAGHRIMTHGSKCRHPHGHRYTIEATCSATTGRLHDQGEQSGMLLDFGFLKEEMLRHIDEPCDHGFIVALADLELLEMFAPPGTPFADWHHQLEAEVRRVGCCSTAHCRLGSKLYVVPFQPTAECLARHWYERLGPAVGRRSDGLARLERMKVWETPNCWAEYGRGSA